MTQIARPMPAAADAIESRDSDVVRRRGIGRWALATLGVVNVGLAALGAVVPGLPTTVFLIVASWCFARSCPWLERRLVRNRFFGPFLRYLEPGVAMPMRAVVVSLAAMWVSIGVSVWLMLARGVPMVAAVGAVVLGVIGTWYIVRAGRAR